MLLIKCFCCEAESEETEFHRHCEAHLVRSSQDCSDEEFELYMFYRKNPKGVCFEQWRHVNGCGKYFHIARSSTSLEIYATYSIEHKQPPDYVLEAIRRKTTEDR